MDTDTLRRIALTIGTWVILIGLTAVWIIGGENLTWGESPVFFVSVIIGAVLGKIGIAITTIIWE